MIKISIIIPSYNQKEYLASTLESVVSQDYEYKEIIVMDGGSTDASVDILKRYEGHFAYWQSQPDGGQTLAISSGIERSTGEIVGWVNSDDILTPGALRRVASMAWEKKTTDAVFYGGYFVIDADGGIQEVFQGCKLNPTLAWRLGPAICQPGTFFGRSVYDKVGGLDNNLSYSMDYDLWYKLLNAKTPFFYIDSIQSGFRRHPDQKGRSHFWLKKCDEERAVIAMRYGLSEIPKLHKLWSYIMFQLAKLINGSLFRTLFFRIFTHRRLHAYQTKYR